MKAITASEIKKIIGTVVVLCSLFMLMHSQTIVAASSMSSKHSTYHDEFSKNEAFAQRSILIIEGQDIAIHNQSKERIAATDEQDEADVQYTVSLEHLEQEWSTHDMDTRMDSESDIIVITLEDSQSTGFVSVEFQAEAIQFLIDQNPNIMFMIESPWLSYYVPTSELRIGEVAEMLDASLDALSFHVEFRRMDGERLQRVDQAIEQLGGDLVYTPVSFNVVAEVLRVMGEDGHQLEQYAMKELPGSLFFPYEPMAEIDWRQSAAIRIESTPRDVELSTLQIRGSQLLPVMMNDSQDAIQGYVISRAISNYAYMVIQYQRTFDDISGLSEQQAIEYTASKLIFSGRDERRFAPSEHLTQAELAAMIVRLLEMEGRDYPLDKLRKLAVAAFDDVEEDDWYAVYAGALYYAGKIPVGHFQAYQKATVDQLNTLLFKPDQEARWGSPDPGEDAPFLTRANAAQIIHTYIIESEQGLDELRK